MSMLRNMGSHAGALRILSVMMGVFLVCMGLTKIDWLMDGGILTQLLQEWRGSARPLARWYLDTIAIPGAHVFARVVMLAEVAAGAALVLGVHVRLAAALALLMVLNFHLASDLIFYYSYLTNPYGLRCSVACSHSRLPVRGCRSACPDPRPPDRPVRQTRRAISAPARASRLSMGAVVPGPAGIRNRGAGAAPVVGVRLEVQ